MTGAYVCESNDRLVLLHPIRVEGPTGISEVLDAIVDTGFTGHIALPATHCAALGLEHVRKTFTMFGNASIEDLDVYHANVFWDRSWREVPVIATGTVVLIGMNMLRGSSVCFDAIDMGAIEIEPLNSTNE